MPPRTTGVAWRRARTCRTWFGSPAS
jgi:hypothetical protein